MEVNQIGHIPKCIKKLFIYFPNDLFGNQYNLYIGFIQNIINKMCYSYGYEYIILITAYPKIQSATFHRKSLQIIYDYLYERKTNKDKNNSKLISKIIGKIIQEYNIDEIGSIVLFHKNNYSIMDYDFIGIINSMNECNIDRIYLHIQIPDVTNDIYSNLKLITNAKFIYNTIDQVDTESFSKIVHIMNQTMFDKRYNENNYIGGEYIIYDLNLLLQSKDIYNQDLFDYTLETIIDNELTEDRIQLFEKLFQKHNIYNTYSKELLNCVKANYALRQMNQMSINIDDMNLLLEHQKKYSKLTKISVQNHTFYGIKQFEKDCNDINSIVKHVKTNEFELKLSKDIYYSMLTLTDWIEEMNCGNSMGLLINLRISILKQNQNTEEMSCLSSHTISTIPIHYLLRNLDYLIKENNNKIPSSNTITGNGIGSGNIILPLYICKDHWAISKRKTKYLIGLLLHNDIFSVSKDTYLVYFEVLYHMTRDIFFDKISDKHIQYYFSLIRTCYEICIEHRYHKGISSYVDIYNTDPKACQKINCKKLIAQLYATGFSIDDEQMKTLWTTIIQEKSRRLELQNSSRPINIRNIEELICLWMMRDLNKELKLKFHIWTNLIDLIDKNYGVFEDTILREIQTIISQVKKNFEHIDLKDITTIDDLQHLSSKIDTLTGRNIKNDIYHPDNRS
jgi:hypothetical protein